MCNLMPKIKQMVIMKIVASAVCISLRADVTLCQRSDDRPLLSPNHDTDEPLGCVLCSEAQSTAQSRVDSPPGCQLPLTLTLPFNSPCC